MVKEAEGATKFWRIKVEGARSEKTAKIVARKVSNSLLFKTALFGSDPNWGKIIAAIGSSEIDFLNQNKIDISIGSHLIIKKWN
jgi:N-acetylglutamate synthase (N-acetylornithine aminotransferase)